MKNLRTYEEMARSNRWHLTAVLWILLSSLLVIMNKFILTVIQFRYVYTLAFVHMAGATVLAEITAIMTQRSVTGSPAMDAWVYIRYLALGTMLAASLVCSTTALRVMDVPTIQMIKAINPAAIYVTAMAFKVEKVSTELAVSIFSVCVGVAMAVYGSVHLTFLGASCQFLSVLIDSSRMVWMQRLMQNKEAALGPLTIMSNIAPSAAIVLWLCVSCFEFSEVAKDFRFWMHGPCLIGSAFLAFALNLTTFTYMRETSALTLSVTGVIKDIFLITVAAIVFDTRVTAFQISGYGVALCGAFMYNHMKAR